MTIKNDAFIGIRLPQQEKEALENKAIDLGLTLTDLIRNCLAYEMEIDPEPEGLPLLIIEYEEELEILERFLDKFNQKEKANFRSGLPTLEALIKNLIAKQLIQLGTGGLFEATDEEMIALGKDWRN